MRIAVFGAGAIGGHIAFRLARGGADVSVVARGAYLAAIRERGLTVQAADVTDTVRVAASSDPAELGPQDAVIVTVKAPALAQVAATIGPLLGPDTPVAFVMNGVPWWYFHREGNAHEGRRLDRLDPGGALWDGMGIGRAIGGVVYSACTVAEPGVVHVESPKNRVLLGEPDGSDSDRVRALRAVLEAGGMGSPPVADIRAEVWAKLAGNMSSGPLAILSGQGMKDVMSAPAAREAASRCMSECVAIGAGLGRPSGMDVAARVAGMGTLSHKPSILQDLELGRPMEIDAQFMVPLELARIAGVPTPTLDLLCALSAARARAAGLYTG